MITTNACEARPLPKAARKAARPVNRTPLADYRARTMAGARPAIALIAGLVAASVSIWAMCYMAESHAGRPAVGTLATLPTLESVRLETAASYTPEAIAFLTQPLRRPACRGACRI
jgi:hypothetical protein